MKNVDSVIKKAPDQEAFAPSMLVKGDTVKEFLNNLTATFAANQQRENALIRDKGRNLTVGEYFNLYHCTFCGEPNGNCDHGE